MNDMISKELAMRVDVQNAELLIFTSRILPMEFWSKAKYLSVEKLFHLRRF